MPQQAPAVLHDACGLANPCIPAHYLALPLAAEVSLPDTAFATVAGLRGSLTLIMAADFIIHSDFYSGGPVGELTGTPHFHRLALNGG